MKNYKEVELYAKNAPTGSYAAGCPQHHRFTYSHNVHFYYSYLNVEDEAVEDENGEKWYKGDYCAHCELLK